MANSSARVDAASAAHTLLPMYGAMSMFRERIMTLCTEPAANAPTPSKEEECSPTVALPAFDGGAFGPAQLQITERNAARCTERGWGVFLAKQQTETVMTVT